MKRLINSITADEILIMIVFGACAAMMFTLGYDFSAQKCCTGVSGLVGVLAYCLAGAAMLITGAWVAITSIIDNYKSNK
jgi:hypothetical protein